MAIPTMPLNAAGIAVLDCEHKTPQAQDSGHPYIAIPNLEDGRVLIEDARRISDADLIEWTRRTAPRGGDIVVTRRGRVGDSAPIPSGLKCAIGQNLVLLRSNGKIVDQRYLRWAVRSPLWWEEVARLLNVGAVFSSLNVRDIAIARVPVPPMSTQLNIATLLETLDDKMSTNVALARTANELAQARFNASATDASGQAMSSRLTPILGGTPDRRHPEYWSGSTLWASARDTTAAPFSIILETAEKISDEAARSTRAKPLPAGSVLLTARGTVGAVARLGVESSFNQSCYGFAPTALPPAVLYFSVLHATEQAKAYAHGSVFSTITTKTFDHLQIPAFAPAEVDKLETTLGPLLDVVTSAARENITLAALRDTLLPELMSGRLRVRDAEEQVGEVL